MRLKIHQLQQENFSAAEKWAENDFSGEVGMNGPRPDGGQVTSHKVALYHLTVTRGCPISHPPSPRPASPSPPSTSDRNRLSMSLVQLLAVLGFFLMGSVQSFSRDLSSSFFTHRFFPPNPPSSRRLRQAFVPDSLSYPLGGSYQPSWQVADMGTMYRKRASQPKKAPTTEQQCQLEGEVCLFTNGILGGAVKLPCCPTSSCVFTGQRFQCVRDISEDYSDNDHLNLLPEQE